MRTRRRAVLLGATAVAAARSLSAPAIAQGIKELKMVTSWTVELQPGWGRALTDWRSRLLQYRTAGSR